MTRTTDDLTPAQYADFLARYRAYRDAPPVTGQRSAEDDSQAVPALTATAAFRVYSNCGAGGYLYYLYESEAGTRYIGCLHDEAPRAGSTYRTSDRGRRTVDVTMAAGFRAVNYQAGEQ
jgi:hypothetical protein